jgi:hypothetical protein
MKNVTIISFLLCCTAAFSQINRASDKNSIVKSSAPQIKPIDQALIVKVTPERALKNKTRIFKSISSSPIVATPERAKKMKPKLPLAPITAQGK